MVAVGPRILDSLYPAGGSCRADTFPNWPYYLDVKVADGQTGKEFYIPCVVGDVKEHTYDASLAYGNGQFHTGTSWVTHENVAEADGSYIEFMRSDTTQQNNPISGLHLTNWWTYMYMKKNKIMNMIVIAQFVFLTACAMNKNQTNNESYTTESEEIDSEYNNQDDREVLNNDLESILSLNIDEAYQILGENGFDYCEEGLENIDQGVHLYYFDKKLVGIYFENGYNQKENCTWSYGKYRIGGLMDDTITTLNNEGTSGRHNAREIFSGISMEKKGIVDIEIIHGSDKVDYMEIRVDENLISQCRGLELNVTDAIYREGEKNIQVHYPVFECGREEISNTINLALLSQIEKVINEMETKSTFLTLTYKVTCMESKCISVKFYDENISEFDVLFSFNYNLISQSEVTKLSKVLEDTSPYSNWMIKEDEYKNDYEYICSYCDPLEIFEVYENVFTKEKVTLKYYRDGLELDE